MQGQEPRTASATRIALPYHTGYLGTSPTHAAPALSTTHIPELLLRGTICSPQLSPQSLKSQAVVPHEGILARPHPRWGRTSHQAMRIACLQSSDGKGGLQGSKEDGDQSCNLSPSPLPKFLSESCQEVGRRLILPKLSNKNLEHLTGSLHSLLGWQPTWMGLPMSLGTGPSHVQPDTCSTSELTPATHKLLLCSLERLQEVSQNQGNSMYFSYMPHTP